MSVAGGDRGSPGYEAIVDAQGQHVHVLPDPILTMPARWGSAVLKELFEVPIRRWSHSAPIDQFGAKPYSNPTPSVPPQRVEPDVTRPVPVAISNMLKPRYAKATVVFSSVAPRGRCASLCAVCGSDVSQGEPSFSAKCIGRLT